MADTHKTESSAPPGYYDAPPPYPGNEPSPYPQQQQGQYPPPQGQYLPPQGQYPTSPQGQYPTSPQYPQVPPGGQYPPPPVYPQQPGGVTVVTAQPQTLVLTQVRSPNPISMQCPNCHQTIVTSRHYDTGGLTWVIAAFLCFVGCWLGCCLIPFCMDECKDVVHTCPNCKNVVSRYNRM